MSALHRADLLRARLPSFRAKVRSAETIVARACTSATSWYVAFSGGKDSLVVLDLVRRQHPHVIVNWSDDELEYDEQPQYIIDLAAAWHLDLRVTLGHAEHGGWFRPWRSEPYWRDPVPGALWIGERIETWSARQGWGGSFVGLRKQEASHRRWYLTAKGRLHATATAGQYSGQWRCNPLANWSVDDVWAYIANRTLPYNPVYDRLAAIGVPRAAQRVGPLPLTPGWILRAGWPDLFRRLVARYGQRWVG